MKSYKVVEFGQPLQKVEEANPTPQGAEVLVRVTAAGVCHSDVHLWEGFFDMGGGNKVSTQKTMNPPRTMGHEIVGEVVSVGPDAKGAKVGDHAVVYPWIGCGKCWYCTSGIEHLCPTPRALGVNNDGGYAVSSYREVKNLPRIKIHRIGREASRSGVLDTLVYRENRQVTGATKPTVIKDFTKTS